MKEKIKNIILYMDILTNIFTILFTLRVFLMFFAITTEWSVSIKDANVYGILFVYVLLKVTVGFIIFIVISIKRKRLIFKIFSKDIIPWIFLSILIISFCVTLLFANSYNADYNIVYSVIFIIGSYLWLRLLVNNIEINKLFKILYIIVNPLCNYLILLMGYFISIY